MDIYIVVGELDGFHRKDNKKTHSSFDKEVVALGYAVDMAKGDVSVGGTNYIYKLDSVIKLNVNSLNAIPMKLVLEGGEFRLKEKPTDGNQ